MTISVEQAIVEIDKIAARNAGDSLLSWGNNAFRYDILVGEWLALTPAQKERHVRKLYDLRISPL